MEGGDELGVDIRLVLQCGDPGAVRIDALAEVAQLSLRLECVALFVVHGHIIAVATRSVVHAAHLAEMTARTRRRPRTSRLSAEAVGRSCRPESSDGVSRRANAW